MDHDLDVHLHAIYAAVVNRMDGFRSAMSKMVETHGATLRRDVLSLLTHLYDCLPALDSEPLTTSSNPLDSGAGPSCVGSNRIAVVYLNILALLHHILLFQLLIGAEDIALCYGSW